MAELTAADHEQMMVAGAVRTDFILSAEIMAISLAEVARSYPSIWMQGAALVIVAIAITIAVYGVVGLIVKMDDIGLHLARRNSGMAQAFGRALVRGMPNLLRALAVIGTAAMLWVGGQIIVHGFHIHPAEWLGLHQGLLAWLADAGLCGLFGLALGSTIVALHHRIFSH
jgi:uncharacterized protein